MGSSEKLIHPQGMTKIEVSVLRAICEETVNVSHVRIGDYISLGTLWQSCPLGLDGSGVELVDIVRSLDQKDMVIAILDSVRPNSPDRVRLSEVGKAYMLLKRYGWA